MWRTDPDCRRDLAMIVNPIISATWTVTPYGGDDADEKALEHAKFIEWAFFECMRPNLFEHLAACAPMVARHGFAPFEDLWWEQEWEGKQVLTLRKLDVRLPRTISRWFQDQWGELTGIEQFLLDKGNVEIPATQLVYYRIGGEGDNWEGTSMLRPAYKPWFIKDTLERLTAVRHEREATGLPVVYPPSNAGVDSTVLDEIEEALANIRGGSQGYLVMPGPRADHLPPEESKNGWFFELVGFGGSAGGADAGPALEYFRDQIAAAVVGEFMRLGQKDVGARATADVQQDPFYAGVEAFASMIEGPLNEKVEQLIALNFDDAEGAPSLAMEEADATSLVELKEFVAGLAEKGALVPDFPLEDYLRERAGLPPADPAARQLAEQQKQAELEQAQALAAGGHVDVDGKKVDVDGKKVDVEGKVIDIDAKKAGIRDVEVGTEGKVVDIRHAEKRLGFEEDDRKLGVKPKNKFASNEWGTLTAAGNPYHDKGGQFTSKEKAVAAVKALAPGQSVRVPGGEVLRRDRPADAPVLYDVWKDGDFDPTTSTAHPRVAVSAADPEPNTMEIELGPDKPKAKTTLPAKPKKLPPLQPLSGKVETDYSAIIDRANRDPMSDTDVTDLLTHVPPGVTKVTVTRDPQDDAEYGYPWWSVSAERSDGTSFNSQLEQNHDLAKLENELHDKMFWRPAPKSNAGQKIKALRAEIQNLEDHVWSFKRDGSDPTFAEQAQREIDALQHQIDMLQADELTAANPYHDTEGQFTSKNHSVLKLLTPTRPNDRQLLELEAEELDELAKEIDDKTEARRLRKLARRKRARKGPGPAAIPSMEEALHRMMRLPRTADALDEEDFCAAELRPLRPWEEAMSLETLEDAIESARDRFQAAAGDCALAQARALASKAAGKRKPPPLPKPSAELVERLQAVIDDLYRLGRTTVIEELGAQGARPESQVTLTADNLGELRERASLAARMIVTRVHDAVARLVIAGQLMLPELQLEAEREARAAIKAEAQDHAAGALNAGRTDQADDLCGLVRGVLYTSVLDKNRCAPCALADDDVLRKLDDPVRLARKPPNPSCLGRNRCRCMEFFVFDTEGGPDYPLAAELIEDAHTARSQERWGKGGNWAPTGPAPGRFRGKGHMSTGRPSVPKGPGSGQEGQLRPLQGKAGAVLADALEKMGVGETKFVHLGPSSKSRHGVMGGHGTTLEANVQRNPDGSMKLDANGDPVWTKKRQRQHERILKKFLAGHKPQEEPILLSMAGGPTAGKSELLRGKLVPEPPDAVTINPDLVKEELDDYNAMIALGDPFAAAAAHDESSYLAKRLGAITAENKLNAVLDVVGNSEQGKFVKKLKVFREQGYKVRLSYATIGIPEAVERNVVRAKVKGRLVPEDFVIESHQLVSARFIDSVDLAEWIDVIEIYDNSGPKETPPKRIYHRDRPNNVRTVLDDAMFQDFLDKAEASKREEGQHV